jgi:magnesium-protoporphyrin O-methyltransferase
MPSCCKPDYDATFDQRSARRELADYRRRGATGTSRRLIEALREAGVMGATVLDIGAGVGVVGLELLAAGAAHLTDVDAAAHYLGAAREEAHRRGLDERTRFVHADFVTVAGELEPADVVTLDRVVCCYGDWRALVDASAVRSRRLYAMVYPRERWWNRLVVGAGNLVNRLSGRRFRFYIHPERDLDARVRGHGFRPLVHERGIVWQTVVYERTA